MFHLLTYERFIFYFNTPTIVSLKDNRVPAKGNVVKNLLIVIFQVDPL